MAQVVDHFESGGMTLSPIVPGPALTAAAERELDLRERLWPIQVRASNATSEEAEADLAAWRDIRDWTARRAQLLPSGAERLAMVLASAQARRLEGMVPVTDDRHAARAQRLLDTYKLAHALDLFRIRSGWADAIQPALATAA